MNSIKINIFVFTFITILFFTYSFSNAQQIIKLQINPQKTITETNCGCGFLLFDEQSLAGDPKNGNGGNIINLNTYLNQNVNTWECGYSSSVHYPAYCYVDLGKIYNITGMYLRDVNGNGLFSVYSGYPGTWNFEFSDNCKGYNSWNAHQTNNLSSRYLRFRKETDGCKISEIVIYGNDLYPLNNDTLPPSTITDLKADSSTKNTVYLQWTAPEDNSDSIAFYELRYSNMPINNQNFSQTYKVNSICLPKPPATNIYFPVTNLQSGTPYYFAVISGDFQQNLSKISNVAYSKTKSDLLCTPYQIIIEPDMIINEYAIGNSEKLADEQFLQSNSSNNQTFINSYWNLSESNAAQSWHYPISILIDLGNEFNITSTSVFNSGTIASNINIFYNNLPFQNRDTISLILDTTKTWKILENQIFINTRYIRFVINSPNTKIGEIYIWGTPVTNYTDTMTTSEITKHKYPLMNEFIGINGFINEPIGKLNCAGFIREYHDWIWNEGNNNSSNYPYQNHEIEWDVYGGYWDFDIFYENINKQGLKLCPVIQNNVPWLTNYNNNFLQAKPLDSISINPLLPSSYKNHANFMFQIAARYGSKAVSDNKLQLADNQNIFSGKNWIKYYENWNEQNKWWKGRNEFFSPYEFAAMSSADFDGHEKTLSLDNHFNLGIKNADSSSKLVMGGLAEGSLDYIKAMYFWSLHNRSDKKIPIDVINLHQYFNGIKNNVTIGISPEEYGIKEKMLKLASFRDKYLPDKEIWLSEFGYNTTANTVYSTPIIGNCSREETQGRWILRTYLELAASGVDKAMLYKLSNDTQDNTTGNTYCSTGITSNKSTGYQPKTAWYYVSAFKNRFHGFRFSKEIESGNSNIKIYLFEDDSLHNQIYAIWCPTSSDLVIPQYCINIPQTYSHAKIITLANGNILGIDSSFKINQNKICVESSEKPLFVQTSTDSVFPEMPSIETKIYIDSTMIVSEGLYPSITSNSIYSFKPSYWVDEQNLANDPLNGNFGKPATYWQPSFRNSDFPLSTYIDLGVEKDISKIFFYDIGGTGDISFSYGTPSNWIDLFTETLDEAYTWRFRVTQIHTRYIRISKLRSDSNIGEIVLYEK